MIVSGSAVAVIASGLTAYLSPWIVRYARSRKVEDYVRRERILALTYDDGPSASLTPQLLDLLRSHNALATFFMLGCSARRFPQVAQRVRNEGHDVGCHSDQHLNSWKIWPWRGVQDINAGYESLAPWVGPQGMFRPAFGKMTLPTYWSVRRRGSEIWWWTIDSGDSRDELPDPRQISDEVAKRGGAIVLLHDLDRSQERNDFVLGTTDMLLQTARRQRMPVRRLSDLSVRW